MTLLTRNLEVISIDLIRYLLIVHRCHQLLSGIGPSTSIVSKRALKIPYPIDLFKTHYFQVERRKDFAMLLSGRQNNFIHES